MGLGFGSIYISCSDDRGVLFSGIRRFSLWQDHYDSEYLNTSFFLFISSS